MKKGVVLKTDERNICLFCGEPMKGHWEDREEYFECDCPDVKKEKEIKSQILKLKFQLPKHKYEIVKESILYKKTDLFD